MKVRTILVCALYSIKYGIFTQKVYIYILCREREREREVEG